MEDLKFKGQTEDGKWLTSNGFLKHSNGKIILIESENDSGFITSPIKPETLSELTDTGLEEADVFLKGKCDSIDGEWLREMPFEHYTRIISLLKEYAKKHDH